MDLLLKPAPHADAAKWIAQKPILARQAFDRLLPDLKTRAFTITGVESANIVQNVRDRIADLPQGADWDDVKEDIAASISPWLDAAEDTGGPGPGRGSPSERRAELLLRVHGYQAYTVAAEEVAERQRAAFPYAQYLSSQDDKVRDSHAALDGIVAPADSPFWDRHTPPWEWGCRCNKVFLSADDVADMEREDADKKPEARRVLSGARLQRLEASNQLTVAGEGGMPRILNVEPSRSFTFDRTTIRMKADELRPRYDAQTFNVFEQWARSQPIEEGRGTVWDWLNQRTERPAVAGPTPAPAAPEPPPEPTPLPVRGETRPEVVSASARSAPVSRALQIRTAGGHKAQIQTAIQAVDRVHDDGDLPSLPIIGRTERGNLGSYQRRSDGTAVQISVKNDPRGWPALTTVHEIGHFLDHQVLGQRGLYASENSPALAAFRDAVLKSEAIQEINRLNASGYYLQGRELWARAYAQYIATRSGDPMLLSQLAKVRASIAPWRQWSDEDFRPISEAIDGIFRQKGWIK